jgi:RNA polymerase sigma-70 factor, ECF subfamily
MSLRPQSGPALTPRGDRVLSGINGGAPGFTFPVAPVDVRKSPELKRSESFEADALALLDGLYRTALRLTHRPEEAEDLVQETYLKAFRSADRFEPGTNLRAWLFTILHNTARNRVRDRARDTVTVDSEAVERAELSSPAPGDTPESLLLRDTLAPDLKAAVDALPDAFREALWLRDVEEFSYAEIAAMLSIPVGTVMSRISRGRRLLFDRLQHLRPAHV